MSVTLTPKNKAIAGINVANGTFNTLLNGPLKPILCNAQTVSAHDLSCNALQAEECAKALEKWVPPTGWFMEGKEYTGLVMFMDFFRRCSGCELSR
jgi:hypothetical protein